MLLKSRKIIVYVIFDIWRHNWNWQTVFFLHYYNSKEGILSKYKCHINIKNK